MGDHRAWPLPNQHEREDDNERGHRTLTLVSKGRKPATIPLPLHVAEVIDAAAGERDSGPLLLRADGKQMDRRAATRVVVRLAKKAAISLAPRSSQS
jgi:integrase/recombinase XerD